VDAATPSAESPTSSQLLRRAPETVTVAFVIPMSGPAGIFGPSCEACGVLAMDELNATSGINGREIRLVTVDGGREPEVVAREVQALVSTGFVDAVAGWHTSAVRVAVAKRIAGTVPYMYGAMHEGGDNTEGVFLTGERPSNQLIPAMDWLGNELGTHRWTIVGNDYVWPRTTAAVARRAVSRGTEIVSESFVPLGTTDFASTVAAVAEAPVDGVVMLLVGADAVHFNRAFAAAGLSSDLLRVSPIVEENTLLAGGAESNHGLYAPAAYFEALDTVEGRDFTGRYYGRFGPHAPPPNAIGESCYEAIRMVAQLATVTGSLDVTAVQHLPQGYFYEGPRGLMRIRGNQLSQDVYLSRADGLEFEVQAQIART
jgi:urea transport system substrate-binding protein